MSDPAMLTHALWLALTVTLPATALTMLAVARGWGRRLDRALLDALAARAPAEGEGKSGKAFTAARDIIALGGDTVRILFVAGCLAGFAAAGRPGPGVALVAIFVSARVALYVLKRLVRRARPDPGTHAIVTFTSSFPSGHTFMAIVTYLSGMLLLTQGGAPALIATGGVLVLALGLAIGAVRVAFRVHWPSDVIAGWLAGIAWTAAVFLAVPAIWRA